MSRNRTNKESCSVQSRGSAMVELMLVTPLIMLFLAYAMEIGRMMNEHTTLTKLAREIGRFSAGVPSLEVGSYDSWSNVPSPGSATGLVYSRADFLFGFYESSRSVSSGAYRLSTLNDGNTVDIVISTEYPYLFGFLMSLTGDDRSPLEVHIVVPRLD